jgi:hypothetical protein
MLFSTISPVTGFLKVRFINGCSATVLDGRGSDSYVADITCRYGRANARYVESRLALAACCCRSRSANGLLLPKRSLWGASVRAAARQQQSIRLTIKIGDNPSQC